MRRSILAAILTAISIAPPAEAQLLDWLRGGPALRNCAPEDRACLILAAIDTRLVDCAKREHDLQIQPIAAKLAEAWRLASPETRAEIDRMVDEAKDGALLRASLDEEIARARPLPTLTLADAAAALTEDALPDPAPEGLPGDWTVDSFVLEAFEQTIARGEGAQAVDFWLAHIQEMWKQAWSAYRLMQRWTAENDLDAFDAYTRDFALSGAREDHVWGDLAQISEAKCATDEREDGARLLTLIEQQFDVRSPEDPVLHLYARARVFPAWLACRSEDEARDELAAIEAETPGAHDFIRNLYPNEQEQAFVLSAAHDTVQLRTATAYAIRLQIQGRPEEAREMYERGAIAASTMTIGEGGVQMGRETIPWETILGDIRDYYAYGSDPRAALRYFLDEEGDPTRPVYDETQMQKPYLDHIAALWPAPLAREAGRTALARMRQAVGDDPEAQDHVDALILFLAGLPGQPAECRLSDDAQAAMLARAPGYRYDDSRFRTLIALVRYRDARTSGADEAAACALEPADL